ncbi:MTH1187 family thiamine-binding protein [Arcobacter sp. LA11]|uniref:MTH1187 family thiamine-binding protein n=1 Tax=Arcobacter sp. LA11 TaxID=1898176 RepID=UPI000934946E|nr:MTH1187 family thiamine-binding protein [Arcobacter sp. LA11]
MSVLLEMAMFPTDHGESKSEHVAQVIKVIRDCGYPYQLTPMATIIETEQISEALEIVQKCYDVLDSLDCNRVYSTIKFDIRKGYKNRLTGKVKSIENKIGEVSK